MAATRLKQTKDGRRYYEIRVRMGRDKAELSSRWYIPDGWSQKAIDRELAKVAAEFERKCRSGEIQSRRQIRENEEQAALALEKISTFKDYANKVFMPALAVTCSEGSRYNYQLALDNHIFPALGSFRLPEITPAQITAFLLQEQRRGLKVSSCLKLYTIINSIFKKAYMEDAISRNPMDKVQRPKATKAEGKESHVKAYTEEELRYILECANKEPLKWRALIYLMADTGIRRGEATGLKWDCVDFTDGTITIRRNLCYTPDKGIYLDTPKNGKSRKIFVDPYIMSLLQELKASQQVIRIDQAGFVFTQDESSEPMHPDSPTWHFKRLEKRYGISDFHPHKLRHTCASVTIKNGGDIASTSEKLGHSDKALTLRWYTHGDEESQKKVNEIFRNALAAK